MKPHITITSEAGDPPTMRLNETGPHYPVEPGWWVGGSDGRAVFFDAATWRIVLERPVQVGFDGPARHWFDRRTTDIVAITVEGGTYRMVDLDLDLDLAVAPPPTPSLRAVAQAAIWDEIEDAVRQRFTGRYDVHANPAAGTVTVILRTPGSDPVSGTPLVEIHNSTYTACGSGPHDTKVTT